MDNGDNREPGSAQVTGASLRARAHEMFDSQTRNGPQARPLRDGDKVVGIVPTGPGFELAIVRSPSKGRSLGVLFFQVFKPGPDDRRVAASGALMLPIEALAQFAALIAEVMDEELGLERAWPRPGGPGSASRVGGIPSPTAPGATRGEQGTGQHDGRRDDHDPHHNGAA